MLCKKCGQEIDNTFVYCPLCGKKQMKTTGPKPLRRANGLGTVYKLSGRRKRPWVAAINKRIVGAHRGFKGARGRCSERLSRWVQ